MANEETKQNYELAYKDYCAGMKYKEIADKYGVTINTVKSWKTRYKWSKDEKKVCTQNQKSVHTKKEEKKEVKEVFVEEVDQVMGNPDLTEKQRLFCIYYVRYFNATKAYQKAYDCSYETAASNAYRMMENDGIKSEIQQLKQNRLNREYFTEEDVFQKYMDIAFSDITDYVTFGTEEVPVMTMYGPAQIKDEKTGKKKTLTKVINTVRFKESTNIDGTLISEVKQGRDGASIKLLDKMKALDWLAEHMDMATEEQKVRIASMKAKAQLNDEDEIADDGFLEALNGAAGEDWSDEEG